MVTLNQRVPGSSPGAPTTQLIENLATFRADYVLQVFSIRKRFQRGSKCASLGNHCRCQRCVFRSPLAWYLEVLVRGLFGRAAVS